MHATQTAEGARGARSPTIERACDTDPIDETGGSRPSDMGAAATAPTPTPTTPTPTPTPTPNPNPTQTQTQTQTPTQTQTQTQTPTPTPTSDPVARDTAIRVDDTASHAAADAPLRQRPRRRASRCVLAARPGRRLWVARATDGKVLSTLKIPAATAVSSIAEWQRATGTLAAREVEGATSRTKKKSTKKKKKRKSPQLGALHLLCVGRRELVVTWSSDSVLVIDPHPTRLCVCLWLSHLGVISDVACVRVEVLP